MDPVSNLLIKEPNKRISIDEIKIHSWVTNNGTYQMPIVSGAQIELTKQDKVKAISKARLLTHTGKRRNKSALKVRSGVKPSSNKY